MKNILLCILVFGISIGLGVLFAKTQEAIPPTPEVIDPVVEIVDVVNSPVIASTTEETQKLHKEKQQDNMLLRDILSTLQKIEKNTR